MSSRRTTSAEQQHENGGPSQHALPGSTSHWAQRYIVDNTPLGRGSFATVHKGIIRATNEPVAIKVMTKARLGERALQMLAAEINILRTLEHPNVVCLRDSHSTERRILIVLEYCGGGDLGQFIQARGSSPESTARHFMVQLASGLAFLTSRRLIHRDIKPQNLLLSENSSRATLKIADFGLARHLAQGSLAESMLGSPLYMAPEVLNNRAYDAKADLWSAGAVLYELLTAQHPFGGANQVELINNIKRNRPRLPPGIVLSSSCVELLGMLLVPRPAERASLQTFLSCAFLNPPEPRPQARVQTDTRSFEKDPVHPHDERAAVMALDLTSPAAANVSALRAKTAQGAASSSSHHRHDNSRESKPTESELSRPSARSSVADPQRLQHQQQAEEIESSLSSRGPAAGSSAEGSSRRHLAGGGEASIERNAKEDMAAIAVASPPDHETHQSSPARAILAERNAEWGWNWGQGAPAGIGVREDGPLPSLPALPFALEPVGGRPSLGGGAEDPISVRGAGNTKSAADFTFDLAFAAGPGEDERQPAVAAAAAAMVGARERRSISANDTLQHVAPAEHLGPSWSRRKHDDAEGAVAASPGSTTPEHSTQRSKSFSGERATPVHPRDGVRERSGSDGSSSHAPSPTRPSPEPVFYLGQGGPLLAPNASPARRKQPQSPAGPSPPPESPVLHSRRASAVDMRDSTPPSPAFCASTSDGGSAHSSPIGGYHTPTGPIGSQPGSPQCERDPQRELSAAGGTSGGDDGRIPDGGGMPMLIKYPSFRVGADSLLTIPEDSTGFVLVTRPSSVSCEHGPHCECWAWSTTPGGGGAGAVRSPSASYLAAANPYGGPGKAAAAAAAAAAADRRQASGGAGPSFLGLGTIWNTAVNTFRGVAGAHARRASWPRRTNHVGQQQQSQRGSLATMHQPSSANASEATSTAAAAAVVVSAAREHPSPHHPRKAGPGESLGRGGVEGSRSNSAENDLPFQEGVQRPDLQNNTSRARVDLRRSRGGSPSSSPTGARSPQITAQGPDVFPQLQQQLHFHHHRRHSEPVSHALEQPRVRQSYPSGLEKRATQGMRSQSHADVGAARGSIGVGGTNAIALNHREFNELRRVQAAAQRAEVVGKRSILVVTLADKTAQEAMSLVLESPREVRAATGSPGKDKDTPSPDVSARRRHDMLSECLALYVRALAMLQAALPGVLVECDGFPTDGFAAWNPLGVQNNQRYQQQHNQPLQSRFSSPAPQQPSSSLLAQRSALIKQASWLKELFSQTLQRAEHCRAQVSAAAAATALAAEGPDPSTPKDSPGVAAPWSTLGGASPRNGTRNSPGNSPGKRSGSSTADTAAAAVYRSAVDHGEKAAVAYLLGRSDAAIAHYVRACALLQLLAYEPEMAVTAGGPYSPGGGGDARRMGGGWNEETRAHGRPTSSGAWSAHVLLMAERFAQRVELISEGVGDEIGEEGDLAQEGSGEERSGATAAAGFTLSP